MWYEIRNYVIIVTEQRRIRQGWFMLPGVVILPASRRYSPGWALASSTTNLHLLGFDQNYFLQDGVVSPMPNPHHGGPGCLS
jgi:hypothetical protein